MLVSRSLFSRKFRLTYGKQNFSIAPRDHLQPVRRFSTSRRDHPLETRKSFAALKARPHIIIGTGRVADAGAQGSRPEVAEHQAKLFNMSLMLDQENGHGKDQ
jgi:RNase adaptor protein for sRNA GlmZ degradation